MACDFDIAIKRLSLLLTLSLVLTIKPKIFVFVMYESSIGVYVFVTCLLHLKRSPNTESLIELE